jgi:hypothetical protein
MKRASTRTSLLSGAVSCQLLHVLCTHAQYSMLLPVTTMRYCYEQQQQSYDDEETSKNCVSDYPCRILRAERGVKRGILRNRNERCVLRMCVPQSGSPSRAADRGKGATSSIVTADVDIPDKVLSRIHLAEVRAKRKSKHCCGLSGHQEEEQEQEQRDEGRRRRPALGLCWYCDRVVKVSFGRVECREFARTWSGTMKWSVPSSVDWEVLSVMVASVDQYESTAPVRAERRTFSIHLKNGLQCGVVTSNCTC